MRLLTTIKSYFIFQHCLLCQDRIVPSQWFCEDCQQSLPIIENACEICGMPIAKAKICGQCLAQPKYFDRTFSPFKYQYPTSQLISNLKYRHQFYIADALAPSLARLLSKNIQQLPDLLLPIPLHPKRLRQRGFNQSAMITKSLSKILNIQYRYQLLIRTKYATPQVELSATQRKLAVKGAFHAKSELKSYPHIGLVDDVMTTSNTVNEAAKALKKSGVREVTILTLSRNT